MKFVVTKASDGWTPSYKIISVATLAGLIDFMKSCADPIIIQNNLLYKNEITPYMRKNTPCIDCTIEQIVKIPYELVIHDDYIE